MKIKAFIGCIVFFVVLYLGIAFGSSFFVERRFHEKIQEANQWLAQNTRDMRIVDMGFDRGLFSSTGQFAIEWDIRSSFMRQSLINELPAGIRGNVVRIVVDNQFHTGPWLGGTGVGMVRINSVANFDPQTVPAEFIQGFKGQNVMTSEVSIGYAKEVSFHASSAPFYLAEGGNLVDYRGFQAQLTSSFGFKKGNFTFNLPYFLMTSNANADQLFIVNLSYTTQDSFHKDLITWTFSGRHESILERFGIVENGSSIFELSPFRIVTEQKIANDLYSQHSEITFTGSYQGRPYQGNVAMDANSINYIEWQRIMALTANGGAKGLEAVIQDDLVNFIKTAPSISINPFQFTYNGQTLDLRSSMGFRSSSAEELKMPIGMLLATKAYYNLSAQIPNQFMTPQFLGSSSYQALMQLVQGGILVRQGGNMHAIDISMEGGRVIINGVDQSSSGGRRR